MKASRAEWIVLGALLAVMAAASVLLGGGQNGDAQQERWVDRSTYNARGSGSKGLYLWLEAVGLRIRRWEAPLTDLPQDAALLLILGPKVPVEDAELQAVETWVRGGGALVLADEKVGGTLPGVRPGPPILRFGLRPRPGGRPATLRPAFPSPYGQGVETIHPTGGVRFQRESPAGWAPLFADEAGDVVGIRRLGRGTIIAVADPGLFSNARLETAGHARLALNVALAHARRGTIWVDEFHHGHGEQSGLARYLRGTAVPWMLGQAGLAFLAFLLARGTRFGAPMPPPRAARASSLEYVAAMGDLYRRAGARRAAAEALAGAFRRTLAAAVGSAAAEDPLRLAARGAQRLGAPEEQVHACLVPGPGACSSDGEMIALAETIHRFEGELRRTPARPAGDAGSIRGGTPQA